MTHPLSKMAAFSVASLFVGTTAFAQGADNCAMAQVISGTGSFPFDSTLATTDGLADTQCTTVATNDIVLDVWFSWTAPNTGSFGVSTCGTASFDTRLAVYSGTSCPTAGAIACDDDGCAGLQSSLSFAATSGTTYLIRLGSYPGGSPVGGTGTFDVTQDMPALNAGNGHYYLPISNVGITWDDARIAAESMSFQGLSGHLVSITDQAENDFVFSLSGLSSVADVHNYWTGGFQNLNSPNYSEPAGGFEWTTGEPFVYTNWAPVEPNDYNLGAFPSEDFIELNDSSFSGQAWNDVHPLDHPNGFVVEFDDSGSAPFCFGDGSGTPCPCGNNSTAGHPGGCSNSAGNGAILTATGVPSVAMDTLNLDLASATQMSFALLVSGINQLPQLGGCVGCGLVAFDGLRCAGGGFLRHGSRALNAMGETGNGWGPPGGPAGGLLAASGFTAGQTRHFFAFYRENPANVCMTGQNSSNGVSITMVP